MSNLIKYNLWIILNAMVYQKHFPGDIDLNQQHKYPDINVRNITFARCITNASFNAVNRDISLIIHVNADRFNRTVVNPIPSLIQIILGGRPRRGCGHHFKWQHSAEENSTTRSHKSKCQVLISYRGSVYLRYKKSRDAGLLQ